ncbi:hypothetical protein MRO49_25905, partial [Escherichia coli]|uniref:hypothetical protein n=1 Tax=Escherichia coli TaxID=562 RepID=UPI002113B6AA
GESAAECREPRRKLFRLAKRLPGFTPHCSNGWRIQENGRQNERNSGKKCDNDCVTPRRRV